MNKYEELEAIVKQFQDGNARELHFRTNDIEVYLSRDKDGSLSMQKETRPAQAAVKVEQPSGEQKPETIAQSVPETNQQQSRSFAGGVEVVAPYMGTFYRSPKPGAAPYVEVGQQVASDTELCLVEVMKLFTAVRAGVSGVIREVLVEDGDMVKVGQALFIIEEAS